MTKFDLSVAEDEKTRILILIARFFCSYGILSFGDMPSLFIFPLGGINKATRFTGGCLRMS